LAKAGFPFSAPEFHTQMNPADLAAADIGGADQGNYFHISPFTTADSKELPPAQLVELIAALADNFPEKKIVLSCAPVPRELEKMERLLALLRQKPWRVLAGNLKLTQLAAVIGHSALHFCGDTGPFHLAVMTNTPTVAWFWPNPGIRQWLPGGGPFRVIVGTNEPGAQFLGGIATGALVKAAQSLLQSA
jgi:ADP-heptose:LPS heptosyltransferase